MTSAGCRANLRDSSSVTRAARNRSTNVVSTSVLSTIPPAPSMMHPVEPVSPNPPIPIPTRLNGYVHRTRPPTVRTSSAVRSTPPTAGPNTCDCMRTANYGQRKPVGRIQERSDADPATAQGRGSRLQVVFPVSFFSTAFGEGLFEVRGGYFCAMPLRGESWQSASRCVAGPELVHRGNTFSFLFLPIRLTTAAGICVLGIV